MLSQWKNRRRRWWKLLKVAAVQWNDHNAFKLAAALSYYTLFSLGPLLILATGAAGIILGRSQVRVQLVQLLNSLAGTPNATFVQTIVAHYPTRRSSVEMTLVGVVVLLFGATSVFAELREDLNLIWKAPRRKVSGIKEFLCVRLLSFVMIFFIGLLLLLSFAISTALSAADGFFSAHLATPPFVLHLLDFSAFLLLVAILFGLIYKILPDVSLSWRDTWFGAVVTSLLFGVGRTAVSLYLGKSAVTSAFGASASVVVLLLWLYYNSLIVFYGAEITQAHAKARGRKRAREAPQRQQVA